MYSDKQLQAQCVEYVSKKACTPLISTIIKLYLDMFPQLKNSVAHLYDAHEADLADVDLRCFLLLLLLSAMAMSISVLTSISFVHAGG